MREQRGSSHRCCAADEGAGRAGRGNERSSGGFIVHKINICLEPDELTGSCGLGLLLRLRLLGLACRVRLFDLTTCLCWPMLLRSERAPGTSQRPLETTAASLSRARSSIILVIRARPQSHCRILH